MRKYFWLLLILIIGTVLRYYHNTDISLWHDEAFSALLIKYPWGEMMYRIGLDVHPPAYYVFLRLWYYVFGDSLFSLRSFSVLFSVGTIWAGWAFVKEAFKNEKAALWVAALIALNPFQIQYATEARMYTFGAFFTLLAAYFLVKGLNSHKAVFELERLNIPRAPELTRNFRNSFWNFLGFVLCVVVMIYTHYYLLFASAALMFFGLLYLFFHREGGVWQKYRPLFLSIGVIAISYIPWLPIFSYQYKQVGAGYWIPSMDIWSVPSTLYTLLVGLGHDVAQKNVQYLLAVMTFVFLAVLYTFIKRTQSFYKWLVLLVTLAPFLGSLLFLILAKLKGSDSSVYLVRYFIFTGAFLSVIVGIWLAQIKIKWLSYTLIAVYCLLNFYAFANYWDNIEISKKPGMNIAAKYLKANLEPSHKLYANTSFMYFNLKYYAARKNISQKPLLYSGGNAEVKNMPHFAGTAILTNQDLLPDFNREVKVGDTVFVVWTHSFGSNEPQVPANWARISDMDYPDVRPYLGTSVHVSRYLVN